MRNKYFMCAENYIKIFFRFFLSPQGVVLFLQDLKEYNSLAGKHAYALPENFYPVLKDRFEDAGIAGGHYFYQDIWAARKIFERSPTRHVDIGSRIDGFIAHLLSFRHVDMVDIRPLNSNITNLNFICDNATTMGSFSDNSLESISTLHAAEHFGLGRYGDPVDPNATYKFCKSLQRVLKPEGRLYFSTPCGIERVCFNAHRIFSPYTVLRYFDELELVSFSSVNDDGIFRENVSVDSVENEKYACGMFEFIKRTQ